jgi:F-type H+-transporting ATPase subunit O
VIDNQRVAFLTKIAEKYIEYYRIFNKEENITIISSQTLTEEEKYIFIII